MTHLRRAVLRVDTRRYSCSACKLKNSAYRTVWIDRRPHCYPGCNVNAKWQSLKPHEIAGSKDWQNPQLFDGAWSE